MTGLRTRLPGLLVALVLVLGIALVAPAQPAGAAYVYRIRPRRRNLHRLDAGAGAFANSSGFPGSGTLASDSLFAELDSGDFAIDFSF